MTDAGVMVTTNLAVEPIVLVGMVGGGGCTSSWKKNGVKVAHPAKGSLPISIQAGCPQILEERSIEAKQAPMACEVRPDKEVGWLQSLVDGHLTLASLPEPLKRSLVLPPRE